MGNVEDLTRRKRPNPKQICPEAGILLTLYSKLQPHRLQSTSVHDADKVTALP